MIGRIGATNRRSAPEPSWFKLCYLVVTHDPFAAGGLSTETNIRMLGTSLRQVFPIPQDHKFDDLIHALDDVCRGTRR